MKLTEEQLAEKVDSYLVELIGRLASPMGKFKVGFIRPVLPSVMKPYLQMATEVGLADGDGIDIDALEQCVMSGFSAGKRIELAGLSFDEAEANRIFSFIKQ